MIGLIQASVPKHGKFQLYRCLDKSSVPAVTREKAPLAVFTTY